jgi:DNA adenine methylase
MPITASPLRYPGGKTVYADMMTKIIELNDLGECTFVEAFAGGAGAAITMLLRNDVPSIILNDYDIAIFAFWNSILTQTDDFLQLLRDTPITVDEWYEQREIYRNEREDLLSLGFATFYLNRTNRAGILAANPIGGLQQNGQYHIDARFNRVGLEDKIQAIADRRDSIALHNLDAVDFIDILEQDHEEENLFIYFDPPYYQKGELLYLNHFDHSQHAVLRDRIVRCEFPWVLSYDDAPEILNLYPDAPSYKKDLSYSISQPKKTKELIISNLIMPEYLELIQ